MTKICQERCPEQQNLTKYEKLAKFRMLLKENKDAMDNAACSIDMETAMSDNFLDSIAGKINNVFVQHPCMDMENSVSMMMDKIKLDPSFESIVNKALVKKQFETAKTDGLDDLSQLNKPTCSYDASKSIVENALDEKPLETEEIGALGKVGQSNKPTCLNDAFKSIVEEALDNKQFETAEKGE